MIVSEPSDGWHAVADEMGKEARDQSQLQYKLPPTKNVSRPSAQAVSISSHGACEMKLSSTDSMIFNFTQNYALLKHCKLNHTTYIYTTALALLLRKACVGQTRMSVVLISSLLSTRQ